MALIGATAIWAEKYYSVFIIIYGTRLKIMSVIQARERNPIFSDEVRSLTRLPCLANMGYFTH